MAEVRVDALIADYRREWRNRRVFLLAARLGAAALSLLYLWVLMVEGREEAFYITLSLAAVVVGLSGYVALFYYEVPQVVRNLHGGDAALADASWAAIERLRPELLPRLLSDLNTDPEGRPALVESGTREELVRLTAPRAQDRWRTIGPIYLAGFLPLLAGYLALVYYYHGASDMP